MRNFLLSLTCIFLWSCGKFRDGTSVWQGGLWLIPTILFAGSAWFFLVAVRARNSGWKDTDSQTEGKEKLPFTSIGQFWFGVGLLLGGIGSVVWVNLDK